MGVDEFVVGMSDPRLIRHGIDDLVNYYQIKVGDKVFYEGFRIIPTLYEKALLEAEQYVIDLAASQERHMGLTQQVSDQILESVQSNGAAMGNEIDGMMRQMDQFANAREELFFGERANFTGAIFRTVQQGGVESLLYRVDLVQNNTFNGVTTDELKDIITQQVAQEIRNMR
jgi:hypothetical protein